VRPRDVSKDFLNVDVLLTACAKATRARMERMLNVFMVKVKIQ
jgi:hypothetical protein